MKKEKFKARVQTWSCVSQLVCMCATTFPTFHGLNEDAPTVGQDPVPAAVAVLAVHHGAQRVGDLKELPPGLMMLLQ